MTIKLGEKKEITEGYVEVVKYAWGPGLNVTSKGQQEECPRGARILECVNLHCPHRSGLNSTCWYREKLKRSLPAG